MIVMKMDTAIGDLNVCKDAANQFYKTAQKCEGDNLNEYFMIGFYPYVVNIAFACELYMKAIMIYRSPQREFYKGHDLCSLFSRLETADKQYIEEKFNEKNPAKNLTAFLTENGNSFVEWRYALEQPVKVNLTGFQKLSKILKDYVDSLK